MLIRTTLILLLLATTTVWGQIQEYWGIRGGTSLVIQDNYSPTINSSVSDFGWFLGISRTLRLADWKSTRIALEGQARYSSWNRYVPYNIGHLEFESEQIETQEIVFAPLVIHSVPVNQARFFFQAGPEIAWVAAMSSSYRYDEEHWKDVVMGFNLGGGIIIPAGRRREIVLDIRYNVDISDAVNDSEYGAPVGSRFEELHLLLGLNFSLDDEGY